MIFFYDVLQGGVNLLKDVPVRHAGTTIVKGAVLMKGVTTGTDRGAAILATGAGTNTVGVAEQKIPSSLTDYNADGTVHPKYKVSVNPMGVYLAEYSQDTADDVDPTSDSSGTTVNCTSIEDIGGGWVYATAGTAIGQLQYVVGAGAGTLTTKTAFAPVLDAATGHFIKILPKFHVLGLLNATSDKLASQAAAGSFELEVLENYISANNIPFQPLDPTKHSGLTGLNSQNVRFYAEVMFRGHILNTRL